MLVKPPAAMRRPSSRILVEAVRRGFDREMRDAFAGERVERTVQRHRIRRGQRAVSLAARRNDADRADARGALAERAPDLPRESGDRGLAAGAGDGGDDAAAGADRFSRRSTPARAAHCARERMRHAAGSGWCGGCSATIAAAPAAIADGTKRSPSALPPAIATKTSPRLTVRLSAVTPPISRPAKRASNSASGGKISRSFMASFLSGVWSNF